LSNRICKIDWTSWFMLSHWMPPLVVAFIGNVRMLLNVVRGSSHGPF
jgi:hypothetical protein